MNKTISFKEKVDGKEVKKDLIDMIELIRDNYNNMGFGNFTIKMYREWRDLKIKEPYFEKLEIEENKRLKEKGEK